MPKGSLSGRFRKSVFAINILLLTAFFTACETKASLTRKRIKDVERGLLKAVVFEGLKPERMRLQERMQYYKVPGVSIAVIDRLQVEWAKAYGLMEMGRAEPLTKASIFQAASVSQAAAAWGALAFVTAGRMALDEAVNGSLTSWKVPDNAFTRKRPVTLRHLLSHTSGIGVPEFPGYGPDESPPSLLQILEGEKPDSSLAIRVEAEPGSVFRYSEGGYAVLQQLCIDIAGRPYPELMEEAVFRPLLMTQSTFAQPLPAALKTKAATGHDREGEPVKGKWRVYPVMAAAGLWTTPSDLALFAIHVMETALGTSTRIVSPELARTMLTPKWGNNGFAVCIDGDGENLHFHLRWTRDGFAGILVAYPSRGQGVVIMTNSANGSFLIDEILRGIADVYRWPHFQPDFRKLLRLAPSIYAQYVGTYQVAPDYILNVTHEDFYLVIQPSGQMPTKFYVEGQTTFFSTDPYIRIRFVLDDGGEVAGLVLTQGAQERRAKKIE